MQHTGRNLDIQAMRALCVLLAERNVSRAGLRLGLSQPGMSKVLTRLREFFGDPLFIWSGGQMVPTPRATELAGEIGQLVETFDRLCTESPVFEPRTAQATYVIAAGEYLERLLIAVLVPRLAIEAPSVKIEVRTPDRLRIARWLESGDVDFSLGWSTSPSSSLRSRLLFSDRLVCIARIGHPNLRDNAFSLADYIALPQVQYDPAGRTTTGLVLEEQFARRGITPNIQIRLQGFSSVPQILATSDLISTMPHRLALSLAERYPLTIVETPLELPDIRCAAYWHERMHENPQNRWFRGLLFDAAKDMRSPDAQGESTRGAPPRPATRDQRAAST